MKKIFLLTVICIFCFSNAIYADNCGCISTSTPQYDRNSKYYFMNVTNNCRYTVTYYFQYLKDGRWIDWNTTVGGGKRTIDITAGPEGKIRTVKCE